MTDATRRTLLGAGLALAGASQAAAAAQPSVPIALEALAAGSEVVPLWPGEPPGGGGRGLALHSAEQGRDPSNPDRWITGVARPVMIVRRPRHPNGAAVLVVPGGGYEFLSFDNEGRTQAAWLNAQGITAYILLYRLPREGWRAGPLAPLQDAQRAVRLIRGRAGRDGVDPARVAVMGFSAGGNLAGLLATGAGEATYMRVDAADALSDRPDLAALLYPVVSLSAPFTHAGSRDALLGEGASEEMRARFSVERRVGPDTPPTFLVHAGDDGLVPVQNSLALYLALQTRRRPAELHAFAEGGHGFGVRANPALPASHWPELFMTFARRERLLA